MFFLPRLWNGSAAALSNASKQKSTTKRLYARRRCNQLLCEGDGYAVPLNGTVEEAAALTAEAMTAFWREALRTARVIVICQGSGDHGAVKEAFRQGFARNRPPPRFPFPG